MIEALSMLLGEYGIPGALAALAFRQEQIHKRQLKILRRLEGIEEGSSPGDEGRRCQTLQNLMRKND